jgi:hypothetical protein
MNKIVHSATQSHPLSSLQAFQSRSHHQNNLLAILTALLKFKLLKTKNRFCIPLVTGLILHKLTRLSQDPRPCSPRIQARAPH